MFIFSNTHGQFLEFFHFCQRKLVLEKILQEKVTLFFLDCYNYCKIRVFMSYYISALLSYYISVLPLNLLAIPMPTIMETINCKVIKTNNKTVEPK